MAKILVCQNPLNTNDHLVFDYTGVYIDWLQEKYPYGFGRPHVTAVNFQKLNVEDYDRELSDKDLVVITILPALDPATWIAIGLTASQAGIAVAVTKIVIGAIISTAISYLANSIFGTSRLGTPDVPAPSPVYSLSIPRNQARLGQPIPVIYGNVIAVPDLATAPYSWFENNDQYVGLIFCLGQGYYDINSIRVVETPVEQFDSGIVQATVFPPNVHNNVFGTIYSQTGIFENIYTAPEVSSVELFVNTSMTNTGDSCSWQRTYTFVSGSNTIIVSLNLIGTCTTPPEQPSPVPDCLTVGSIITVSNSNNNNGNFTVVSISGDRTSFTVSPALNEEQNTTICTFRAQGAEYTEPWANIPSSVKIYFSGTIACLSRLDIGKTITLNYSYQNLTRIIETSTSGKLVSFYSPSLVEQGYIILEGADAINCSMIDFSGECTSWPELEVVKQATNVPTIKFPCQDPGEIIEGIDCGDKSFGPFIDCPPGKTTSTIYLDFIFPAGLYATTGDGDVIGWGYEVIISAHLIDDDGNYLGITDKAKHYGFKRQNYPTRETFGMNVTQGRHAICIERNKSPYDTENQEVDRGDPTIINRMNLVGLKAVLPGSGFPVYENTTLIAVKAKATSGLSDDALSRFTVDCFRKLPDFREDGEDEPLIADSSHVHAFCDIYRNEIYGARRPKSELDIDKLKELYLKTNCLGGFNAVFDTKITIWEALSLTLLPVFGYPITNGQILSAVLDEPKEISTHCFNESNILKESLQLSYKFDEVGAPDGVEVEYRNPLDFSQAYEIYPSDSVEPESINLFGCTNQEQAFNYAQRTWRQRLYRRQFIKFSTELEGYIPLLGDLISVEHKVIGDEPSCYVVGLVSPDDEFKVTIEGHKYQPLEYKITPEDQIINLNSRVNGVLSVTDISGARTNGITVSGFSTTDVVEISLPPGQTYIAWSPYGKPAYDSTPTLQRAYFYISADECSRICCQIGFEWAIIIAYIDGQRIDIWEGDCGPGGLGADYIAYLCAQYWPGYFTTTIVVEEGGGKGIKIARASGGVGSTISAYWTYWPDGTNSAFQYRSGSGTTVEGPPLPSGSLNHFYTLSGSADTTLEFHGTNGGLGDGGYYYNGYDAARAAFIPFTLTGATEYTFVIVDGLLTDNSGGLSIQLHVQSTE